MASKGVIGVSGLKTAGNELTQPPGSTVVADECVVRTRGVIEPRFGQMRSDEWASTVGGSWTGYIDADSTDAASNRAMALYQWGDHLLVNYTGSGGYKLAALSNFASGVTRSLVGSHTPPAAGTLRMKFAQLTRSLYWTTDAGIYTVDSATGTARSAGIRAPEGIVGNIASGLDGDPSASGSWLATNKAVGLRACLGFKDANNVVHLSAPCGRLVVVNPADVTVAVGGLVRNANVVTATVAANHGFMVGDIINLTLSGGDIGNFNPTNNTITSITSTTIVWAETAANYTNVASVTISSGTKKLAYGALLPPGMTTSHFVQFYRTDESATATTDPGDEHFLVYERYLTSSDISAKIVTVADTTPSDRAGAALATNANSGDGINRGANLRPPICRDICVWDGRLWGGETTDSHRLSLRLLGTGSPNGLQSGDVICFNTIAVIAGTDFTVYTEFLPTQNAMRTLRSMTFGLNYLITTSSIVVRILMNEADGESFGLMSLEEDGVGGSTLYASCSRVSAFAEPVAATIAVTEASSSRTSNVVTITTAASHGFTTGDSIVLAANALAGEANFPTGVKTNITVTGATTFTYAETGSNATMSGTPAYFVYATTYKSDNNKQPVRFSKQLEPEAWPLGNTLGGLPDGAEVLRVTPLGSGDGLVIALKNAGFYLVSGAYPYVVRRLDDTADLVAADTLVSHAGRLHALTTQGLATITEAGVGIVGGDVEDDLRSEIINFGDLGLDLGSSFGVSHEADRLFLLFVPRAVDGYGERAYVYNSMSGAFARWTQRRGHGIAWRGNDRLVLGDGSKNMLRVERRAFVSGVYGAAPDERYTLTVVGAHNGVSTITCTPNLSGIVSVGDVALIGGDVYNITAINGSGYITIDGTVTLANNDTFYVYVHKTPSVTFVADAGGAPGIDRINRELQLHFGYRHTETFTVSFVGEKSTSTGTVTVSPADYQYGTEVSRPTTVRVSIPSALQRSAMMRVTVSSSLALAHWKLLGYTLTSEAVSERTGK